MRMETIRLSGSSQQITRVGLGGCPLGGHGWGHVDDSESIAAIRRALELGVNFFDTADVYGFGHSEKILSKALGSRRHSVVIGSKFGVRWDQAKNIRKDISPKYLRSALDASLRRLHLECLPLYYIHWPDGITPIGDAMEELERLRRAGKVRWIGVSNFSAAQVREALAVAAVHALQVQFSLVDRGPVTGLLPLASQAGITVITWGSLAQGLLSGKYDRSARFGPDDRRHRYGNFLGERFDRNLQVVDGLRRVAQRLNRTPAQVAIRWLLDTRAVGSVLFGAKRPAQIEENACALGWNLSDVDYAALEALTQQAIAA